MFEPLLQIANFVLDSFLHAWPYLLVTIPIAVAVKMSGASRYINKAFTARPIIAIFLATIVGAFSPLCSCSVIPVVAALLISGVPLGPVMSFWIASPSMDPEIFFLTVSSLGWELAIWRLAATLALSLGSGFITSYLVQNGWLGKNILRDQRSTRVMSYGEFFKKVWGNLKAKLNPGLNAQKAGVMFISGEALALSPNRVPVIEGASSGCGGGVECTPSESTSQETSQTPLTNLPRAEETPWGRQLLSETWDATTMVVKFMLLAWFLGALTQMYVPQSWITSTLGGDKPWAILIAAVLGVPVYTSNLAAMPLIGGLLAQGMNPAAALAFLISGPTTTLPAMSAVWGLVNRRVFALYIGFSLVGAILLGTLYQIFL